MCNILSGIHSLDQHLSHWLAHPDAYKPSQCPHCLYSGLWAHGIYERQSACECEHDPGCSIPIPRFLCPHCRRTCSTLPEFIAPRRWYHWAVQQAAFMLMLMGNSLLSVWSALFDREPRCPSQSTVRRWYAAFKRQYETHRFCLCSVMPDLGYTPQFTDFWQACLHKQPLSSAMVSIHRAGERIL